MDSGFYEERIIDGEIYCRTSPGGAFYRKPRPRVKSNWHPIDELLNIAEVRLKTGSRKQAQELMGLEPSTLSRIRKGSYPASSDVILRLYDGTGLSIEVIREKLEAKPFINATLPALLAATTKEEK